MAVDAVVRIAVPPVSQGKYRMRSGRQQHGDHTVESVKLLSLPPKGRPPLALVAQNGASSQSADSGQAATADGDDGEDRKQLKRKSPCPPSVKEPQPTMTRSGRTTSRITIR